MTNIPPSSPKCLPMTYAEMQARGWDELDVLLITGDAYVDHPSFGTALVGRVLEAQGWRVGVIAQPDWNDPEALTVMGRPRLFCGISAGNLDSMVSNYTAARRKRRDDAYSEGGQAGLRPNHAVTVYTQLARRAFPGLPTVIGGIEASMRRVAHYDYWQDKLRPSILADSKADILLYGMAEKAVIEIARRLHEARTDLAGIPGTAVLLGAKASREADFGEHVLLASYEDCLAHKHALLTLTKQVEAEQNPLCGRRLVQCHGERALLVEPPAPPLEQAELDALYELPFTRLPHPSYQKPIPAFTMIKDSVTVVRGCPGGCSFCGLGLHQGKFLASRSEASVLKEIRHLTGARLFRGTISDLGGPSANLYGCANAADSACRTCRRPSCLYPHICNHLRIREKPAVDLMRKSRQLPGVKHVFISSGIRMDVAQYTPAYTAELVRHHVSGHLKVAPEHLHPQVLKRMRKPGADVFSDFRKQFERESRAADKQQYIVPYFISSFPGCTADEMKVVEDYLKREHWKLQQVQDFIPLPMTAAAAMYYTGLDYETEKPIPVTRGLSERKHQKSQLTRRR